MPTSLTAYTPLESFLLFRSLEFYGVEPTAFSKISDLLKNNAQIREAKGFDGGRLSPDALRELYLRLLKQEIRSEIQSTRHVNSDETNGDSSPNSRKRKVPSPGSTSAQEASQNAHLIPQLVAKLYARYRQYMILELREDERHYIQLKRELAEIQRGEWDEKLRRRELENGKPSRKENERHLAVSPPNATEDSQTNLEKVVPAYNEQSPKEQDAALPIKRQLQSNIEAVINNPPIPSAKGKSHVPPSPSQQPSALQPAPPSKAPSQPHGPPHGYFPPPQSPVPGYQIASAGGHQSSYLPTHPQAPSGLSPSPKAQKAALAKLSPSSPVLVPNAPSVSYPPPIPPPIPPSPSSNAAASPYKGPHPGTPHQYPPSAQRYPPPVGPGSPLPGHGYPSQQAQTGMNYYPPYAGRTGMYHPPHQQGPSPPQYPPHQGGYQLPPFQVNMQDPIKVHQQQKTLNQVQTPTQPRTQAPPVSQKGVVQGLAHVQSAPSTPHPTPPTPSLIATTKLILQRTVNSAPRSKAQLPPPLNIPSNFNTRWKSTPTKSDKHEEAPPVSPISEPGSPQSPKGKNLKQLSTQKRVKHPPKSAARSTRQDASTRAMITRGGSTASSAVGSSMRGRTRSQSVISYVDELSLDAESIVGRRVKHEPSTPAEIPEEVEDNVSATEATPSAHPVTRGRRGTLQSVQSHKRKRSAFEAPDSFELPPNTPGRGYIIASRNFPRMSQTIMNDINSHKHASMFSQPVKEKDAEGYRDMVRRPQDLKSIRTAIVAGSKVVSAAASGDTPVANSPGGSGGNVILPISPELVPPKGIVNAAQLEKEVMRMLANAVMFNPGEDGVVKDAREMFDTVEESINIWRSAERTIEAKGRRMDDDTDELAPEEEAPPKRRKA